jgi:Asp-tRNA(Asn)/Glu-tRNA(Gln) amidotransferase A subunit family amidase
VTVAACLRRIQEREHSIKAWVRLDPEPALDGLPLGVKDVIDTADLPTAYGSPALADRRPAQDAEVVRRLRAAGAVVLGKTTSTEFALYHPAATRNPHDLKRTPGGSSSGSAAAVADGMVPVALGTQTAGSVIRPASFCGVFGFKPTFGLLSTEGVLTLSPSLDTVGLFARTAADLRLLAGLLGIEAEAPPPRIGFLRTPRWAEVDASARARIEATVAALSLEELELPARFDGLVEAQITIMESEVAKHLGPLVSGLEISPGLAEFLARCAGWQPAAYDEAQRLANECRGRLDELFGRFDLLLTPAVRGVAPAGLDSTGDPLFCRTWTLLGTPAVAVPGLAGQNGLPLGIQLVGRPGADALVLAGAELLGSCIASPR